MLNNTKKLFMLENYLPVLIFVMVSLVLGSVLLAIGFVLAPHKPDIKKNSPFECGFEAFEDSHMKFDVRYYLVAILFIVFDLEITFLFPWALVLEDIGAEGFIAMAIFLVLLTIGFIYEWKKGALEWD
jgi:NADH-quinone oxidoreductase subunit A